MCIFATCFTACNSIGKGSAENNGENSGNGVAAQLSGTYDITMWVSELKGVAELTQQQIDAFEAANPGIIINASIEGVAEADAGSKILNDVVTAPDIFTFSQDQLARLVQAAALVTPGKNAAETIKNTNDSSSVDAASIDGTLYAYPMTSDNGYFMYYDTSLFSDEDVESLETLIAKCEENNVKFRYNLEDGWYTASFFFATGCKSIWTTDKNGAFLSIEDTFNSPEGLLAMKGMQKLAKSPAYDNDANVFTDAGIVVTGAWNASAAAAHFGENLGATDLPSFEIDGSTYHLGSYTGNKLMGVKPQADAKKAAVLSMLAQYLTSEECQAQRYAHFGWGPSNKNVQASEDVQKDISLSALAKQNQFGQPQGQIHGSWWDIAKSMGAYAKSASGDADLQNALVSYTAAVNKLLEK